MRAFGMAARGRGLVAAAVLLAAGCAGKGDLVGTVTYKGQKLRFGSVQVRGSDGVVRTGQIDAEGGYVVPGVPAGPATVAVTCQDPRQAEYTRSASRSGRAAQGSRVTQAPGQRGNFSLIPEKYSDLDKSGLQATVRGTTAFDIELN